MRETNITKTIVDYALKRSSLFSGLANPSGWLTDIFNGKPSATGVSVTEQSAMQASAVYACVRILAETIASLPLPVYKRIKTGGQVVDTGHYLFDVLNIQPNSEQTAFQFWETLIGHVMLWGNAYACIERNGAGQVVALWPLLPDRTYPYRDIVSKKLYYITTMVDGVQQKLWPNEIIHIAGLGFNGIAGHSPIQMAREAVGLSLATEEFGARFFGNGAKPGGILEHPNKLTPDQHKRLRESAEGVSSGLINASKMMILEDGMKYHTVGIPPEDAQFLETRKFQLLEICRLYRVPPHMIAEMSSSTFSNIEHQSLEFVIHTVRPWLVRIEQQLMIKLLTPTERKSFFVQFTVEGLLRGDIKSRYEAYAIGKQNGFLSTNMILKRENENPVEGGDEMYVGANMIPVSQALDFWKAKSVAGGGDLTSGKSGDQNIPV